MPYPKDHAAKTRENILRSAYRLFVSKGYDAVSIDEIMQDCGMTRGGFYAHFPSKSGLYREAILHAAAQSRLAGDKPAVLSEQAWIRELLAAYLDKDTSAKTDWPCPLAFFATDVVRREPEVRDAYTRAFASMSAHIFENVRVFAHCSETTVLAVTAMLIGTVAVARTVDDDDLRGRLLASSERMALDQLQLG